FLRCRPLEAPPATENTEEQVAPVRAVDWKRLNLELLLTSDGRKVAVINGRRFQEGDILDSGPRVEKITDDSVIVALQGEIRTLKRHTCFGNQTTDGRRSLILSSKCSPDSAEAREIALSKRGQAYYISATLNGKQTVEFLLDTGATSLSIPEGVALTLMDAEAIAKLPTVTVMHANGNKVQEKSLKLDSVQIGLVVVREINAIISAPNSPALLGMAVLEKLGTWHIDNKRRVLIVDKS
ncbi:MAG: TIGR02281 family clan AA aspartic protease, partial [Magnetococcales bacterium]|nr:TIGR02281 family clan AA aspartic protease [Magnetococcales bacterium]